jgi:adenosylcobinamide-GDP ribazoletransferase
MNDYADTQQKLIADLRIGLSLCTRLPLGPAAPVGEGDVARASWTFPIAGLLVGLAGTLVYWLAIRLNVAPPSAAALTLATTLLLTGAMHEDGLADTADGLGGRTREQKLEIMRDSRIGTFGACALAISLLLRWRMWLRAPACRPSCILCHWPDRTGFRAAPDRRPGRAWLRRCSWVHSACCSASA